MLYNKDLTHQPQKKYTITYFNDTFPKYLKMEEIGRYIWRVLHTKASKYPVNPNLEDKHKFTKFLYSLYL